MKACAYHGTCVEVTDDLQSLSSSPSLFETGFFVFFFFYVVHWRAHKATQPLSFQRFSYLPSLSLGSKSAVFIYSIWLHIGPRDLNASPHAPDISCMNYTLPFLPLFSLFSPAPFLIHIAGEIITKWDCLQVHGWHGSILLEDTGLLSYTRWGTCVPCQLDRAQTSTVTRPLPFFLQSWPLLEIRIWVPRTSDKPFRTLCLDKIHEPGKQESRSRERKMLRRRSGLESWRMGWGWGWSPRQC